MSEQFYTYLYKDPKTDKEIYVGKGKGNRANAHLFKGSRTRLSNVLRKRQREGFTVEPIIAPCVDEQHALEMEKFWIHMFGREDLGTGTLFNKTDGGDSVPSRKGAKNSPEHREKISKANTGKIRSSEFRNNVSRTSTGRKHTEETRARMRKPKADSTRAKMSARQVGELNHNFGKTTSDDVRQKISESGKRAWEKRRMKEPNAA